MLATISSTFDCTLADLIDRISQIESLEYVCAPIVTFTFLDPTQLEAPWQAGMTYHLKMKLLGFIPVGRHEITIVEIDRANQRVLTNESGSIVQTWNHTLHAHALNDRQIHYTDEIEIKAGIITFPIWLFAHFFYRHRQRRWRGLFRSR